MQGIYKPIPKRWREAYNVGAFSNNLQIWLSIFTFSIFATSSLFSLLQEMDAAMPQPSFIQLLVIFVVVCFLFIFLCVTVWSLVSLIILCIKGFLGQKIEYDPETTNPGVLKAIVPIIKRGKLQKG